MKHGGGGGNAGEREVNRVYSAPQSEECVCLGGDSRYYGGTRCKGTRLIGATKLTSVVKL